MYVFFFVCCRLNVYRSALIFRNLPCPEKFLVTRLKLFIADYMFIKGITLLRILVLVLQQLLIAAEFVQPNLVHIFKNFVTLFVQNCIFKFNWLHSCSF